MTSTLSVVARLTFWMVGAMTLLLGVSSFLMLRAEREQLQSAVERELRTLGGSAEVAITTALRDGQEIDVRYLVNRIEAIDAFTDIVFVGIDGSIRAATLDDAVVAPAILALAQDAARTETDRWLRDADNLVALALPLKSIGSVLVVRRLSDIRDDMTRTFRAVLMTAVVAILLVGSISIALGTALVRRPLETTTAAMRRVRDGDLEAMVTPQRRDELGTIASEFNELVGALRRARIDLKEEEERRRTLESNLARADKLMVVGQLAAGLAHEIGTPLHVVAGRARRIVEHPEAPAEVLRLGKIVVEQTERIARIVDQVVRFSRRPKPERRLIDVREPVQAVLSLLEGEAQRSKVKIVTEMVATAAIFIDGDELQQVTLNLVRNALAATPMGGTIKVSVSEAPADKPSGVRLIVADTGIGVAPDDVERMFEPFFTTRHEAGGTGLGLAVVRSIVQAHRGTIGVETGVGRGTTLTVTFPRPAET